MGFSALLSAGAGEVQRRPAAPATVVAKRTPRRQTGYFVAIMTSVVVVETIADEAKGKNVSRSSVRSRESLQPRGLRDKRRC
jgi:hypothetical protein